MTTKLGSRVSRRASTKSPTRVKCQHQTKRALRLGRLTGTKASRRSKQVDTFRSNVPTLSTYTIGNPKTKKMLTFEAASAEGAIELALGKRLALKAENLEVLIVA